MSFILDALKKSESDRQRQSGPSLFEVKVAPPRRRLPIWAVAIAVLLGINVIVISWMLLRHPAATQPAAAAPSLATPPTAAPHHDTLPAAPVAPPPAQAPESSGPEKVNPPPAGDDPGDYAPAVEPAAPGGSAGSGAEAGELPLYQQIVGSDGLPALHLDLHVFADRPKDRFVMINMHRLGEGDSLPGGVHVDAIRPDGAVLSYRGTRFLLPRN